MEQVSRVHVLQALEHLVDDVLLVDVLKDIGADHRMQVSVHEVKHQVDVAVVFGTHHVLQADDVLVARQLLQENDLSEGALRVRGVLERIEVFLEGNDLLRSLVDGFPDNAVGALPYINKLVSELQR